VSCKRAGAVLQAEGRRFIAALERAAAAKHSSLFDLAELYTIADRIELQAEVPALLEDLRDAGERWSPSVAMRTAVLCRLGCKLWRARRGRGA
jgi:hypothetical protein